MTVKKILVLLFLIIIGLNVWWLKYWAPMFGGIPEHFSYSADIVSIDNLYDPEVGDYIGDKHSVTEFSYKVVAKEENVLIISNSFGVRTSYGDKIFAVKRMYGIDQITGAHVAGFGDKDREGYLFAPKNLSLGEDFTYWHINYNGPAHMKFAGEEILYGLPVYRYSTRYQGVTIDQTNDLEYLPDVPELRKVLLDPQLTIWVEPETGWLVKYEDETTANFYDSETDELLHPWNKFSNAYVEESVIEQVAQAKALKTRNLLIDLSVPILSMFLFVLAVLYFIPFKSFLLKNAIILSLLLVIALVATVVLWRYLSYQLANEIKKSFNSHTGQITNLIYDRLEQYQVILHGVEGLVSSSNSEEIQHAQWSTFIEAYNLETNYPDIKELVFVKPNLEVFQTTLSKRFGEDSLHFDSELFSDPVMKQKLAKAETSETFILLDNYDDNLILYLPSYLSDEQESFFNGHILAYVNLSDLIAEILEEQNIDTAIEVEIHAGEELASDEFVALDASQNQDDSDVLYTKKVTAYFFDSPWTIVFKAAPSFRPSVYETSLSNSILVTSAITTPLVIALFLLILSGQARAERYARQLNRDLIIAKSRDEAILSGIPEGLVVVDQERKLTLINHIAAKLLEIDPKLAIGKSYYSLVKVSDKDKNKFKPASLPVNASLAGGEITTSYYWYQVKNKEPFLAETSVGSIILDGKIVGAVEIFKDVTKEEKVKTDLKNKSETLERLNRLMVGRELKMRELKRKISELESSREK